MYNSRQIQKCVTGRELFAIPIAGDWNKSSIKQINDGVISGIGTDLSLREFNKLNRLSSRLLIDGSIIIVDGNISEGSVLYIEDNNEVQTAFELIKGESQEFIKVWIRDDINTVILIYGKDFSDCKPKRLKALLENQPLSSETISSKGVLFVENGLGVLVPAQATLLRLVELSELLSQSISEDALRWFVNAYGANIDALNGVNGSKGPFGTIPEGASFEHMYDKDYTNDIFKQMEVLVPAFKEMTSNFVVNPGESGISRFIGMMGYINKVVHTQKICEFVFSEYGINITFKNIIFDALRIEVIGQQPTEA